MTLFCLLLFIACCVAFNGNTTFSDGTSVDLRTVNLSLSEMLQVSSSCSSLGGVYCSECLRHTEQEFADAQTDPYLYNIGLASCLYTRAFSMRNQNAQLRSNAGQSISSSYKSGIMLTASSLTWHRQRNRAFIDKFAPIVFRGEPNLKVDNCWIDSSSAIPSYDRLTSNISSFIFMSTSISPYYPVEWVSQTLNGGSTLRILAIYRNVSSSLSAAYLWPVPTVLQSEATYSPGQFFFHLACRRSMVASTQNLAVKVAWTLMYEATTGTDQRLSAKEEAAIEKALNSVIDTYNTTCIPYVCLYHVFDTDYHTNLVPTFYECVDTKSGKAIRSARQHPNRIVPSATCALVGDRNGVHFVAVNGDSSFLGECLSTANDNNNVVLTSDVCSSSAPQTFLITKTANATSFHLQFNGTSLCLDPNPISSIPTFTKCDFTRRGLTIADLYIASANGYFLVANATKTGLMWGKTLSSVTYWMAFGDNGAQFESRFSIPSALQQQLRKRQAIVESESEQRVKSVLHLRVGGDRWRQEQ